ncbi:MAG: MerR family transcriptional regulator [Alphaproteobacteria bacterium]
MAKADDALKTISEVADELDVPQHVLRFWESKFSQIKPMKRAGSRRYYRPADLALLRGIQHLLHEDGMTIKGVQKMLKDGGVTAVVAAGEGGISMAAAKVAAPAPKTSKAAPKPDEAGLTKKDRRALEKAMKDLLNLRAKARAVSGKQ